VTEGKGLNHLEAIDLRRDDLYLIMIEVQLPHVLGLRQERFGDSGKFVE